MKQKEAFQKFIIKLFSEIMVKGDKAKRQMIAALSQNLHALLLPLDETIAIKAFSDKIEVNAPARIKEKVQKILLNTPGIGLVLVAKHFQGITTMQQIKEATGDVMLERIKGKHFVVRAKRTGKHPFGSHDIERSVGGYLLAHAQGATVDLHNPEVVVRLELINSDLYIVTLKLQGLGGFPMGTQGEVLSLISGGFDSSVATYLMMSRGIKSHFLFFNLGGKAHEIGVKQVAYYLWKRFGATHPVQFVTINFEQIVEEILSSVPPSYMGVMLKRLMLQAAEKIADKLGIDALVTGESIAQVSSQTLRNLAIIDSATTKLTLRPLSTMNKPDIIDLADKIGVRRFAETMPEYCGVISKNPVTEGSFKRVAKIEDYFDFAKLGSAVEEAKVEKIDTILGSIDTLSDVEVVHHALPDDTIIDIRAEAPTETIQGNRLHIPFYKLKSSFKELDPNKRYLLYCDKGVLSKLHSEHLKQNYPNFDIKVYRPSS